MAYQTATIGIFDQGVLSAAPCQVGRDFVQCQALQRTDLSDAVAELIEVDQADIVGVQGVGNASELLEQNE